MRKNKKFYNKLKLKKLKEPNWENNSNTTWNFMRNRNLNWLKLNLWEEFKRDSKEKRERNNKKKKIKNIEKNKKNMRKRDLSLSIKLRSIFAKLWLNSWKINNKINLVIIKLKIIILMKLNSKLMKMLWKVKIWMLFMERSKNMEKRLLSERRLKKERRRLRK